MTHLKIASADVDRFAEAARTKKILIIGDVGVDRYTFGEASRISDEAPVPIVAVTGKKEKLGLAANVADNVTAIGGQAWLCSLVGNGENTETLFQLIDEKKINRDYIFTHESRTTTLKERVVANNQQVVRIDHERKNPLTAEAEDFFWQQVSGVIAEADAVILEDYAKGLISPSLAQKIITEANKQGKFIAVDPPSTVQQIAMYKGASVITPNQRETERMVKSDLNDTDDVHAAGKKLLEELQLQNVALTQGKNGMTIFSRDEDPRHIPSLAREVFDVSGAGDTVVAVIALAVACGFSMYEAAVLANFAAAVEVGKTGTATVTVSEIRDYIEKSGALV